jgi:hypothetical protein
LWVKEGAKGKFFSGRMATPTIKAVEPFVQVGDDLPFN